MYLKQGSSISYFIVHANHVLDVLENTPEAQGELARYGFGLPQMQEGRALIEQVRAAHQAIEEQKRQQKAATDTFHEQWQQVRRRFQIHVQAARRALGRDAEQLLRASPKSYTDWISHADEFYRALLNNPLYLQKLGEMDVEAEDLANGHALLQSMVQGKLGQTQRRQSVRLSTQERNGNYEAAKNWFDALMAIARVCFRQYPGILEAIRPKTVRPVAEEKGKEPSLLPQTAPETASPAMTMAS